MFALQGIGVLSEVYCALLRKSDGYGFSFSTAYNGVV